MQIDFDAMIEMFKRRDQQQLDEQDRAARAHQEADAKRLDDLKLAGERLLAAFGHR